MERGRFVYRLDWVLQGTEFVEETENQIVLGSLEKYDLFGIVDLGFMAEPTQSLVGALEILFG